MSLTTRDIIKTYFETGDRPTQQQFTDWLDSIKWYDEPKVWAGRLSGGNPTPSVTVITNSLGGTIVWTRNSAGNYTGTLAGAFVSGKTYVSISNGSNFSPALITVTGTDTISVVGSGGSDGNIVGVNIKIEVYP